MPLKQGKKFRLRFQPLGLSEGKELLIFCFLPIIINEQGIKQGITPTYIQWFLTQEFVANFLSKVSEGKVMPKIPRKILYSLKIPISKNFIRADIQDEIQLITPFRAYLRNYYKQYSLNYEHQNFDACAILAGAMCEAILYQLLIDNHVPKDSLDNDHNMGLGKLIEHVKDMKLDEELEFNTQYFTEVKKLRNNAVHFGRVSRNSGQYENVKLEQLIPFNNVIKQFGI